MITQSANGVVNFITTEELRIPTHVFEVETNIILNIPEGMAMIISTSKYAAVRYGININPSPLIISSDETAKPLTIPLIWDGIDRWAVESDLHGRVKIPANTCIAKAIIINISQYCCEIDNNIQG